MSDTPPDGTLNLILAQQTRMADKQADMATDVALVKQALGAIPVADFERRLRSLEKWKYGLPIASLLALGSAALAAYGWLHH